MDQYLANYIYNYLLDQKIHSAFTIRHRPNQSFMITLRGAGNLCGFYSTIKPFKDYQLYHNNLSLLNDFLEKVVTESDNRLRLAEMIKHDFNHNLKIKFIASKFKLNIKVIKRIIDNYQDQQFIKYKLLINATSICGAMLYYKPCEVCNIYIDSSANCTYCNKTYKFASNISYAALHRDYSSQIRKGLKRILKGKDTANYTIQKYTDWTFPQLKMHLEQQFAPWMTWESWGVYSARKWKEDDSSTWRWQIDHIRPVSDFKYKEKSDADFIKCWGLSNLRPYSAKLNIIEGANRIRHTKDNQ